MKFTKMHGLGNDYIYVNAVTEKIENPAELAVKLSDRHFGIGGDGLILITASEAADAGMAMYNADGSCGSMCGNGIRCVAKYIYEHSLLKKNQIRIETMSGIKETEILTINQEKALVRVNMGRPGIQEKGMGITVGGTAYTVDKISMGNPHAVLWSGEIESADLEELGPKIEYCPAFGERVNAELVRAVNRRTIAMRVWERGAGETYACGTGACAAAVSGVLNGLTEREVTVTLIGGDLSVRWSETDGNVYMTGPAVTVFEGEMKV